MTVPLETSTVPLPETLEPAFRLWVPPPNSRIAVASKLPLLSPPESVSKVPVWTSREPSLWKGVPTVVLPTDSGGVVVERPA